MASLDTLLDLQAHDVRIDQLRHRRAAFPERAEVASFSSRRAELAGALEVTARERDLVAREQKRREDQVALIVAKWTSEDKRLYSGTVSAARELQAIQDELKSLDRRRNTLEDQILTQMELAEPLDATLVVQRSALGEIDAQIAEVQARLDAAEAVVDTELAVVVAERKSLAEQIDPATLRQYNDLRRRLGGVAVARLEGSSCRGCHLQLAAVELERIRKLDRDVVVHCEECGRILVR